MKLRTLLVWSISLAGCQSSNSTEGEESRLACGSGGSGAVCGDDRRTETEVCDGADLGGLSTCSDLGYASGSLACRADCLGFDLTDCAGPPPICNNNIREPTEVCDGSDLGGLSACSDLGGYASGSLACRSDCLGFDLSDCERPLPICSNGKREKGEICDGTDLGGPLACSDLGFLAGDLACRSDCLGFDRTGCIGPPWGCDGRPVIDTHVHIYPSTVAENDQYLDELVRTALASGVTKLLLGLHARHLAQRSPTYSTTHDRWVMAAAQKYPDVIIPLLAGFDPADPNAPAYVETELATGRWHGIGELDLRNEPKQTETPANSAVMMQIYRHAATYDVPVLIHHDICYGTDCASGTNEWRDALSQNPNTVFISAHSCMPELMAEFSNLYCEFESPNAEIPTEYADRMVVGTDVQSPDLQVHMPGDSFSYPSAIDRLCAKMSTIPVELQHKISHSTAEQLFHLN